MRVAVVHGYFLADSGSGIYVRELTRELVRQGHDVTLFCQERRPEGFDFIDVAYDHRATDSSLSVAFEREGRCAGEGGHGGAGGRGTCRLVRPDLGGRLLVYVPGEFEGFEAKAFQEAPQEWIDAYVGANARTLAAAFARWPQDVVLVNHAIMQPFYTRRALEAVGARAPYTVIIHGSALNFSVKTDPRLVPYALDGLEGAKAVTALSAASRDDVVEWASASGLDISGKAFEVPPGVAMDVFDVAQDRASALAALERDFELPATLGLDERDDVLVAAGRLLWTKGLQHVVAALPLIAMDRPRVKLLVAGSGPAREPLALLIAALDAGDLEEARRIVTEEPDLRTDADYGPVVPALEGALEARYAASARRDMARRIAFVGHVEQSRLAKLFASADSALAPSVFAEAFGLVGAEALASGALPISTYQTGLTSVADTVSGGLDDPALRDLAPGVDLTTSLASTVAGALARHPTKDAAFRRRLHALAAGHFAWSAVVERYLEVPAP